MNNELNDIELEQISAGKDASVGSNNIQQVSGGGGFRKTVNIVASRGRGRRH